MDIEVMQTMMKEFYRTTGMLGAVLDLSGKVLVSFGWQDICTKFHRCNPATLRNCLESDTLMTQGVAPGTVKSYKCKNNLWDMVTPLVVGGRHLGNVFFGQFLKENEVPDVELFRAQAQKYGFDETEYLAALARIPHFNSEAAEAGLLFCAQLASIVTTLNYNAIKQARMIAERERLKEELLALNEDLESKVVERTAALEASNKELESFSYSVSHDLRAPVRHISSFVDILNNEYKNSLPDNAKHYLDRVSNSARQMGILIDDLLDFSRTGRQDLRRSDIDMNAVVQGALEKLRPDLENRNISWKIADLPHVYGDFSLLNQVWINLLENAVKYTRKKELAKIEVGCTRKSESWEFFVSDNGVGFDMQYAHKLYGVFQRLHSSVEFEGTGIGLANVQRIIHKHGGQVRAEGQLDKGATFYFTIPD
jgi:signal transduction histidine kinase